MASTNNQHQNGVWRGINPSSGPPFGQEGMLIYSPCHSKCLLYENKLMFVF
jgi:hypothetical protein